MTVFVRWFRLLVLILRRVTIQHDEAHDKENDSYNHHHDCSNRIQRVRFIKSEGVDEQEERDQDPRDAGEELQRECFFSYFSKRAKDSSIVSSSEASVLPSMSSRN